MAAQFPYIPDGTTITAYPVGDGTMTLATAADFRTAIGAISTAAITVYDDGVANVDSPYTGVNQVSSTSILSTVSTGVAGVRADVTLERAALTGAVTASQNSNTTALGSFTKAELSTAVSDGNVLFVGDVTASSGTYSPTRSAEANLDSNVTMSSAQYSRAGNVVTVSGRFTADPTTPATITSFEIDLPVASNIGAIEDLAGVAFSGAIAGQGAAIFGVAANDTAKFSWIAGDVTSQIWSFIFSYEVI